MTTRDLLRTCRRRWATILLSLLLALAGAAAVCSLWPTVYSSTVKAYVSTSSGASLSELQQGSSLAEHRTTTYADLAGTPAVLGEVIEDLGLDQRNAELAEHVTAEAPADTTLLEITATASSAQQAADIADVTMASLRDLVNDIEQTEDDPAQPGQPLVELDVVQEADVPLTPQGPRMEQILGLGAGLGLVIGLGAAFLRESLDSRIRGRADIEELTTAPLLAITHRAGRRAMARERASGRRGHLSASDFRQLRTRMHLRVSFDSPSSYLITSSLSGEGKTTVAVNLARSLQSAGRRVLLIEADLLTPKVTAWLSGGVQGRGAGGLIDVLNGTARFEEVIVTDAHSGVDMITAGGTPEPAEDPRWSENLQELLESCAEIYDVTIIDGPALLSASDTVLVARMTTGVLLIARYGEVTQDQLAASVELLNQAKARIVGTILSAVPTRGPDSITAAGLGPKSPAESGMGTEPTPSRGRA